MYDWHKELNYKPGTVKEQGSSNSDRDKKIKELKCRLSAVEAKTTQSVSDSDSDSSDPAFNFKGKRNKKKYN